MTLLLNNSEIAKLITMPQCIEVLDDAYREHGLGRAAHRRRSNIIVPTGEGRTYVFANFEGTVIKSGYHAIRLRSDVNEWLDEKGDRTTKYASRPGLFCGLALLYNIQDRRAGRHSQRRLFAAHARRGHQRRGGEVSKPRRFRRPRYRWRGQSSAQPR